MEEIESQLTMKVVFREHTNNYINLYLVLEFPQRWSVTHKPTHTLNLIAQISQSLLRAFKGSCLGLESKTSICKCGIEEVAFGRGGTGNWGLISVTKTTLNVHYTIFYDHTECVLSLHIDGN